MIKLNVYFTPEPADELSFNGKTLVVIDVLRASNTIITALANGAKEIIPVGSVDSAVKISRSLFGGSTILGGERNTKKIEGFNLGNSPSEYSPEKVKSKTIVLFTTNGSKAVLKGKFSGILFVCGFINIAAVVKELSKSSEDIEIICSGNAGTFSMEDAVCAGMIINELKSIDKNILLSDSANAASVLYKTFGKNILKLLKETEHGRILIENGFEEDIIFCSKLNTTEVIPYLSGNVIKLYSGK